MSRRSLVRVASIVALLAGCVDLPEDELEVGEVEQFALNCPDWGCSANSSRINTYDFHELNIFGAQNTEGFRIFDFVKGGTKYQIDVVNGRLRGRNGALIISGAGLVNAEIRLEHTDAGGVVKHYALKVLDVNLWPFFADNNGGAPNPQFEAYRIYFSPMTRGVPTGPWRTICKNPNLPRKERLFLPGETVVLFEGERISAKHKSIAQALDPAWFNIGCAGHALAKMYMTGHVEAAASAGYPTSIDDRRSILKMFTGDYCGTGRAFTVPGVPLEWMDHKGWMDYEPPPWSVQLEARWTPNGASCLNTPRVVANSTPLSDMVFGLNGINVIPAIAQECGALPPACAPGVIDLAGHHLNSANP